MINQSSGRHRSKPLAEINVVPYIDVMLVLLVIFMVTAPLFTQGVKVALPEAEAKALDTDEHEPLVLTVDRHGQYYLNTGETPKQALSEAMLLNEAAALLARKPNTSVVVRGDEAINYGKVVSAMVILQQAGAKRIGLMTDMPASAR